MKTVLLITEPSITMLLITAVGGLVGAIVWLALYIRKLHNRSMEMAIKFIESTKDMKNSVDACVKAVEENSDVTRDLHTLILKATSKNGI